MRICMIGHKYVPSREGGIEVVVEELSSRMAKLNHEVILFNRKRKQYQKQKSYRGCQIEEVFTVNKKSLDAIIYSFFATLKVRKLIKQNKVDIVHYHAEGPCLFLNLLPRRKKRPNTKLVVTIHGLDWKRGKWKGLASKLLKLGEKKAVKYADEIIVLSKNLQLYFEEKYHRKTNYIPNGISKPNIRTSKIIEEKYGLEFNSYILFLARIVPEKGLDYLIEAWKKVKEQIITNKKLVIAGGSSHSDEYYKSIMSKIEGDNSIIATGFVCGQELEELYSNAYLYVLPSDVEGMPMSLLEAMSYGNTCLVSDIPENTEIINEDCFVFRKGDVDRLRHQIKKIINLNLKTHENTVSLYDWDSVVEQTINLYQK